MCPSNFKVSRMCCRQCLWPVGLTDQNQTACWPQAGYLTTRSAYGPCGAAIRRRAAGGSHRHHAVCNPCAQAEPASSVRAAFGGTVACREPTSVVQAADFTESCACKRNSLRAGHVQVQQLSSDSMRLYSGKVQPMRWPTSKLLRACMHGFNREQFERDHACTHPW